MANAKARAKGAKKKSFLLLLAMFAAACGLVDGRSRLVALARLDQSN